MLDLFLVLFCQYRTALRTSLGFTPIHVWPVQYVLSAQELADEFKKPSVAQTTIVAEFAEATDAVVDLVNTEVLIAKTRGARKVTCEQMIAERRETVVKIQ